MKNKSKKYLRELNKTVLFALVLGVLYWIVDSGVHSLLFQPGSFVEHILRPDSHEIWMRSFVVCIFIFFGGYARFMLFGRKQAEEKLRESNHTLRALIQASPLAIIALDSRENVKIWNPAAERIFGWSEAEVLGRPNLIIPIDNRNGFSLLKERALRGNALTVVEVRRQKKDSSVIDISLSTAPLRDANGEVIGVMAIIADISESKRSEKALQESEKKLHLSQKLESVGRLAGGIAHDFNNLLTTILGYADLILMEQDLDDTVKEGIQDIKKSAERAASLTQQLLAFSRKQVLQPRQINLNKLITNMEKMLKRLIHENIDLITKSDPDTGPIKADPGKIEQVIMNLAINARDAMPDGGKLNIETQNVYLDESYRSQHPEVTPGVYVLLAVSDTGHGMDEEIKKHIFEPFFTTKRVGEGTGLGLSTVYGIVKQSGGYIWVYSEPGHGTTFKIYLPRVEEIDNQQENVYQDQKARGGTETILLVEDEEALKKMAGKILKKYGYTVIEGSNGIGALETIAKSGQPDIDLLITDVIMPEMGGKDLAERLLKKYPGLKVLYISGYTDDTIVHHGVLDEGVSFLQKPFSPQSLAQRVREVLDEA